jgi:sugar/nucleoside kinase (ribokinase family)
MKRLGVLGSVNRDTITRPDRSQNQRLGGILYTAMAAAHMAEGGYETWLLAQIGVDIYPEVEQLLKSGPLMRTEGVKVYSGANPHCRIRYEKNGSKVERLTGDLKGFRAEDLLPYLATLDVLVVNFITGYELTLQDLQDIRQAFRGFILIDVHSLTLGRHDSGERYFRTLSNWRDWLSLVDMVQMNEKEAALLGGWSSEKEGALAAFIKDILALGCKGVVITKGIEGCLAGEWQKGRPSIFEQAAAQVCQTIDPTGCGDVFLAGLAAGCLEGLDFKKAIAKATQAAAVNCRLQGVTKLDQLATLHHKYTA